MHPKISKDPFYSELYPDLGDDGIAEAGFFYDSDEELTDPLQSTDLLCTPLAFEGLPDVGNPAVLLCTGAFCPPHNGHLEMMKTAKAAVEKAGYTVTAGYLSPGHDEYIEEKTGDDAIPVYERIKLLQNLIYTEGDGDWLAIDPWEGVFNKVAVNFTDVIVRLEAYLKKWTGRKIPVFYVCGADNARFAMTFLKRGHCVLVGRPGYEDKFEFYRQKLIGNSNIIWATAENSLSSTTLRKEKRFEIVPKNKLLLRVEEADEREFKVIELLKPYFKELELQKISEQQKVFDKMDRSALLSLDALLPAVYNLEISRIYDLYGLRFLGFSERPGSKDLEKQIELLPKEVDFTLFDDDMCFGSTLNFVKAKIEAAGRKVTKIQTLAKAAGNEEILDCRDFIIGGKNNGLVIKINDKSYRVPYIYPYCCPFIRASINLPMSFSIEIWKMNRDYFQNNKTSLSDLDPIWQNLFFLVGFDEKSDLEDICNWHLEKLIKYI